MNLQNSTLPNLSIVNALRVGNKKGRLGLILKNRSEWNLQKSDRISPWKLEF